MAAAQAAAQAAELSGNDQIISIYTPSLRQRKCRKRKGVVLADRPRLAIGRPHVARWRRHRRYAQMRTGADRVFVRGQPVWTRARGLHRNRRRPRLSRAAPTWPTACRPRSPRRYPALGQVRTPPSPRRLLAVSVRHRRRYAAATLLAHHAPGIAYNHLAVVHAPPEPLPLAIPAVPNVAR
ncbi:hypothetical protein C8R45DRAFT_923547 [Mycena sanguinolenta]|nr:hypothetical protein C8R45DRAFT_923547 [Mycena sanguinolenta]